MSGSERFIKAEKNAVDLIVDILNRYNWNIDKVTKHQDYTNKYCPHRTLDMGWDRFLNMIKEKLNETRERPFIIGDIIYNISDLYLHETAGYGGKSMLLKKGTKGVVKKYHYNNGLYMALGDATSYYDAAWTNEFEKFTKKAPEEEKPRVQEENKETSVRNDKTEKNDNNKVQEQNKDTTREENKETEELLDNQDKRVNALLWLVDKIILFIKQVFRKRK